MEGNNETNNNVLYVIDQLTGESVELTLETYFGWYIKTVQELYKDEIKYQENWEEMSVMAAEFYWNSILFRSCSFGSKSTGETTCSLRYVCDTNFATPQEMFKRFCTGRMRILDNPKTGKTLRFFMSILYPQKIQQAYKTKRKEALEEWNKKQQEGL